MAEGTWLLANAYRPVHHGGEDRIDVWANPLTLGAALPTVPLPLKGAWPVPLDLEATYSDAASGRGSEGPLLSHPPSPTIASPFRARPGPLPSQAGRAALQEASQT